MTVNHPPTSRETGAFTSEQFLEKLRGALQRDGDFPASARVITELRKLAQDPRSTANQIAEVILREPSLGTRVLHLVNSSFYRRSRPIMTVSQAVIQIGMKPLAELCTSLVLLQKFVPPARQGGTFARCLRQTILTSILSSSLPSAGSGPTSSKSDECGYLAGSLSELGMLLLAYYFPQVYDKALQRAESKRMPVSQAVAEMVGLSTLELSLEVARALDLPEFYQEVIRAAANPPQQSAERGVSLERAAIMRASRTLFAARALSETLSTTASPGEFERVVRQCSERLGCEIKALGRVLGQLPDAFGRHCAASELNLPALPDFIGKLSREEVPGEPVDEPRGTDEDRFAQFVEEIREAVRSREPSASVITTVMETLAWGLKFDRVLLMLIAPGRKVLLGRMLLGEVPNFDPKSYQRPLGRAAGPHAPDAVAVAEGRSIFTGDSLFLNGWPLTAIPLGFGTRCIGVIYADRCHDETELSPREQAAIGLLAELLDRSITGRS